jgi:hypothetical protein
VECVVVRTGKNAPKKKQGEDLVQIFLAKRKTTDECNVR